MSELERRREENIRRNQAFLTSIGLSGPSCMSYERPVKRSRKSSEGAVKAVLIRRSARG